MRVLKTSVILFTILAAVAAFAWQAGDRVLGQWSDGYWYPACVAGVEGTGYSVAFDDGDTALLPAAGIKRLNWSAGTKVQCNWRYGGVYYSGTITEMDGESIHILYDDGDREYGTISMCRSR